MAPLVLASTSPYRRELLARLGWAFTAQAPTFNEESAKTQAPPDPLGHAAFLAKGKAQSLAHPDHIVIGGDQLVAFDGRILGKPKTFDKAVEQLSILNGKSHEIYTAVCVVHGDRVREWVNITKLHMRRFSSAQIEQYVRLDHPLDCAGSYKFEKHGVLLFDRVECDDFSAIQGLPLLRLAQTLLEFGLVPFPRGES